MKRVYAVLLLVIVVNSCVSQQVDKSELAKVIEKNIYHIEFFKLSFFTEELIQLATDTAFQSKFKRKLKQHDNVKRRTDGDQKEYDLTLNILYKKLSIEKKDYKEYDRGRNFLLDILRGKSEVNFSVDEKLIIQQIDGSRRSLVNGYDEGTVDESLFLFFCYDPLLYREALLKNDLADDWKRTGIFLCNYLSANENPTLISESMKSKILSLLERKENKQEFNDIIQSLKECDVSLDLYD